MQIKFSRCICLSTDKHRQAVEFYRDVIGLTVADEQEGSVEFAAEPYRLFVDRSGDHGELTKGMVLEFIVDDLGLARRELEAAGCTVLRWEGAGKDCYMQDPFGAVFNLWQDPEAFK